MTNVDKALLLAEWSRTPRGNYCCVVCMSVCMNSSPSLPRQHGPDCAMDLALSERGYCTQEERDRARAFVASPFAPTLPPPTPYAGDADSSDPNFDADPDDGGD
jgi:hypothetical protein